MKTIRNFDEGLDYVNRLGFNVKPGFPGWIIAAQKRLCDVEFKLWETAGKRYPFKVRYSRKTKQFFVHALKENGKLDFINVVDAKGL